MLFLVQNLSQQSDISDLLGGFKPTDARVVCIPLYEEFKTLFVKTYSKRVKLAFIFFFSKVFAFSPPVFLMSFGATLIFYECRKTKTYSRRLQNM